MTKSINYLVKQTEKIRKYSIESFSNSQNIYSLSDMKLLESFKEKNTMKSTKHKTDKWNTLHLGIIKFILKIFELGNYLTDTVILLYGQKYPGQVAQRLQGEKLEHSGSRLKAPDQGEGDSTEGQELSLQAAAPALKWVWIPGITCDLLSAETNHFWVQRQN